MPDWELADPAEGLIEALEAEPADLVVSDEMLFSVPLGCEALAQKHVLLAAHISRFPMPSATAWARPTAGTAEEVLLHADIAEGCRPPTASVARKAGESPVVEILESIAHCTRLGRRHGLSGKGTACAPSVFWAA